MKNFWDLYESGLDSEEVALEINEAWEEAKLLASEEPVWVVQDKVLQHVGFATAW